MKRSLPIVLLLIAAVCLVWWLAWPQETSPKSAERAHAPLGDTAPLVESAPVLASSTEPRSSARDATAAAPAASDAAAAAAPVRAKVDKTARDWVQLLIQDRFGAAIASADVKMVGLRTRREPGSHHSWPDEPSVGRSDAQGKVRLWHPLWVNSDDETGSLTFLVTHPEYVARTVDQFEIGPELREPRVVVLERGAFVIVSGWIDSPSEVITAIEPHLTWEVRLAKDAWLRVRDGRLSTANIPPGEHALYLSYAHPERGVFFSDVTRFTLGDAEQKELHLQLHAPRKLEGRIEDEVPRPVRNGLVQLNLQIGSGPSSPVRALRTFDAPIREDGTFTFANLPPGDGQIIALCDGWASERVDSSESGAAASSTPAENEPDAKEAWRRRDMRFVPAKLDPAEFAAEGRVFVLAMEPTSSLKATLKRADGTPAAGVKLSCWPNVRWSSGFSSVFLDHEWSATSDARGRIEIANMPWGSVWCGVEDRALALALVDGERSRQLQLEPGQLLELELEVVAKEQ